MSELDIPTGGGASRRELSIALVFAYRQSPIQVWRALTEDIGLWWSERVHPEARTVLDPSPGGAWTQLWSNGGAYLGTVTHVHAPVVLRLSGPLAMTTPVTNIVDLRLELMDSGSTRLHVTHHAIGMLGAAEEATYTEVWHHLFEESLTAYLERSY